MLTGVQWLCDCGKPFALAPRAFHEGMVCPACGVEVTPKELLADRSRTVSRRTHIQSLSVLFLFISTLVFIVARPFLDWGSPLVQLACADLGLERSGRTSLTLPSDIVLTTCAAIEVAALGSIALGRTRKRRDARPTALLTRILLLTGVAVLMGIALRNPMIELVVLFQRST